MMRRGVLAILVGVAMVAGICGALGAAMRPAAAAPATAVPAARFMAVDVFVDSGAMPLAAWQVEVKLSDGTKLAGVEGGDSAGAFAAAPTYDPAALMNERVIIAAFSLEDGAKLPTGRVRVARLHVQLPAGSGGDAEAVARFEAVVQAAAGTAGNRLEHAAATLAPADMDERSGDDQ
jgi:hypothetical protein